MNIKKGDKVKVIAGKEKGKTGTVLVVLRAQDRVVIEGLNMSKHFMKPKKAGDKAGIVEKESSLHISNVALMDKKTK